jgi:alpha-L-fucosidase
MLNLSVTAAFAQSAAPAEWFRDARFGMLITWGLYSIPAGEWKGQIIQGPGESIMHNARIPVKEYAQLASQFHPAQFDAEGWVSFADKAGVKYIVFTAKQHDGFAMYHSAVSKYNVYDSSPFHRDPLKELADACAKHKMKLGIYYSDEQDWHDPNGAGNDWDFGPDNKKNSGQYLRGKVEPQEKEM